MRTITQQSNPENPKIRKIGVRTILAALVLAAIFTLTACGESALVGRWELIEGPSKGNIENMELLNEGAGITEGVGITWKTEKDRIYITHPLVAVSFNYKLQGAILTLTSDDGKILKYQKIGTK